MKNPTIIAIIVLIVGGGAGFFAGMKYQQSKTPVFAGRNGGGFGGARGGGGTRNGFTPVNGQIINNGNNSITVQLPDGSSKIVLVTGSTQINKASLGTAADLTNGQKVAVFGSTNSDGSVTAQNIQINPIQRTAPTPGAPQQ
jgi:hypothetical protein